MEMQETSHDNTSGNEPLYALSCEEQCYFQKALLVLTLLKRVILFCLSSTVYEFSITLLMANNYKCNK